MLQSLHIQNYALIQTVKLEFSEGLNVIIGETGAGKSIMLGALQLILGKRADSKVLFREGQKCIVEGVFSNDDKNINSILSDHDLDQDEEIIIRREINARGKSRAFINDTPVTLSTLTQLASKLIDLHQQFDFLDIHQAEFQQEVVDVLADNAKRLKDYQTTYKIYKTKSKELTQLKTLLSQAGAEKEFFEFQFNELEQLKLEEGEQEILEEQQSKLSNAEGIKSALSVVNQIMNAENQGLLDSINLVAKELEEYASQVKEVEQLYNRTLECKAELDDISHETEKIADLIEYDPQKIAETKDRLDQIYRLQQKHKKNTVEELLELQDTLRKRFVDEGNSAEQLESLEKELAQLKNKLTKLADQLHQKRSKAAPSIELKIKKVLSEMAMPNARIQVRVSELSDFNPTGKDKIEFYFAANKGFDFTPLSKVASGGEISRLNLSIKSLIAGKQALPTLVFDEIDAGISGEVAKKMGRLLKKMSSDHQIISITHAPQIAASGEKHFFVYKEEQKEKMETAIRVLDRDDLVWEIGRMISGEPPQQAALANAKELITELNS